MTLEQKIACVWRLYIWQMKLKIFLHHINIMMMIKNMRDNFIYENKLKNNATNEQYIQCEFIKP